MGFHRIFLYRELKLLADSPGTLNTLPELEMRIKYESLMGLHKWGLGWCQVGAKPHLTPPIIPFS